MGPLDAAIATSAAFTATALALQRHSHTAHNPDTWQAWALGFAAVAVAAYIGTALTALLWLQHLARSVTP